MSDISSREADTHGPVIIDKEPGLENKDRKERCRKDINIDIENG